MDYIDRSHLTKRIEAEVIESLSVARATHSRSTAATAKELSARFGEDQVAAYLAGISHDNVQRITI